MIIIFKGKGILVLLYLIVPVVVLALLRQELNIFSELPATIVGGLSLLISGLWTKLTAKDYYKDKNGRKVYLDTENSFFFIKMSTWALILESIGVVLTIAGIIEVL